MAPGRRLDQLPQQPPPFVERPLAEILAIEMQEIEGDEHQPGRLPS